MLESNIREGTLVIIQPGVEALKDFFPGQGVVRGQSASNPDCIAIQRLDGVRGGAQDGFWNFKKEFIPFLVVLGDFGQLPQQVTGSAQSKRPTTIEEWFKAYTDHRFKGVPEGYKILKDKDDSLKANIDKAQAEYQALLAKRRKTDQVNRDLVNLEMLMATLAQDRIQMENRLRELGARNYSLIPPEELKKQLLEHKRVKSVTFSTYTHCLLIGTEMIRRPKGIVRREMGEFQIELPVRDTIENLRIYNKTWRYRAYDHPHINNGNCCMNEYRHALRINDQTGNLLLFLDAIFAFLENVTRGGEYCAYSTWFRGRKPITFNRQ